MSNQKHGDSGVGRNAGVASAFVEVFCRDGEYISVLKYQSSEVVKPPSDHSHDTVLPQCSRTLEQSVDDELAALLSEGLVEKLARVAKESSARLPKITLQKIKKAEPSENNRRAIILAITILAFAHGMFFKSAERSPLAPAQAGESVKTQSPIGEGSTPDAALASGSAVPVSSPQAVNRQARDPQEIGELNFREDLADLPPEIRDAGILNQANENFPPEDFNDDLELSDELPDDDGKELEPLIIPEEILNEVPPEEREALLRMLQEAQREE